MLIGISVLAALYGITRLLFGSAETIARRKVLIALRCAVMIVLGMLFLNPVVVTETPGDIDRPEMFFVLDSSSSMQMGSGSNRWDDSLRMIDAAEKANAEEVSADVRMFRFGQRLSAVLTAEDIAEKLEAEEKKAAASET